MTETGTAPSRREHLAFQWRYDLTLVRDQTRLLALDLVNRVLVTFDGPWDLPGDFDEFMARVNHTFISPELDRLRAELGEARTWPPAVAEKKAADAYQRARRKRTGTLDDYHRDLAAAQRALRTLQNRPLRLADLDPQQREFVITISARRLEIARNRLDAISAARPNIPEPVQLDGPSYQARHIADLEAAIAKAEHVLELDRRNYEREYRLVLALARALYPTEAPRE